ncbi:GGDEF domain-containing protein [Bradyrhizobium sp. CCBAU 53338]|nr:GGDEF domain-containing protein [Bradyrhizobium sp. CCBAU 53338]
MVGLAYLFDVPILLLYCLTGGITVSLPAMYCLAGVSLTLVALVLSELRLSDRLRDHYMTAQLSIGNIAIQLTAAYVAPEIGFFFISTIFFVVGYGCLRMTGRQTGLVWTFAAVGSVYLFMLSGKHIALPMDTPAERSLALLCFLTTLARCAIVGLYGSSLREMLYKKSNELESAHARIEQLAQTDELTGVLNRRYIMRSVNEELLRAQRKPAPCSVAIIDLDLFKGINDTFGHPVGDEVLRSFAIAVSANIRSVDRLGRYGGEEFLLVLPETPRDQAIAIVDRLRQIVGNLNWDAISNGLKVTMSAGVAQVRQNEAPEDILARSDAALYRSKDAGRNRVTGG